MAKKASLEETFQLDESSVSMMDIQEEKIADAIKRQDGLPVELKIERSEVLGPIMTTEKKEQTKLVANCLRNEKIILTYIKRPDNKIQDPKHVLYGGMLETARKIYSLPSLRNGTYVNPFTDDEKTFLESELSLEHNALSVHKSKDNYWDDYTVVIGKDGKTLDLSNPSDYIAYKVLLANTDYIAQSFDDIRKKGSYTFYISHEGEEASRSNKTIDLKKDAYIQFGKIDEKKEDLKYVIQIMTNKIIASNTKMEQLRAWVGEQVESNPKLFLEIVKDPFYHSKKLVYKAVEYKIIRKTGDFYYLHTSDGLSQLSEKNEEPTFKNAVKYLESPRHQEIRLTIETKILKEEE